MNNFLQILSRCSRFVMISPILLSILGIFSLDLSKPITMEIYTDSCDDLLSDIKPFMA